MSALNGLKVADFSWIGAGPLTTLELANDGATVVKIESSKRLDPTRYSTPFKDGIIGVDNSGFFLSSNASKYSATLNLQHPRGPEIAKRFVNWADVVVENYSYGFMDRVGLGYDELMKVNSDIIMLSVSIPGRTGPLKHFKGFGNSGGALSGQSVLTGWPGKLPLTAPLAWADLITPLFSVIAIMAALEYREQTGKGQYIDISQLETMVQFISPVYLDYFANGYKQSLMGNHSLNAAPHGAFPCQEDDTWCTIAIFNDAEWTNLCIAMGRLDLLENPKFKTLANRKENEDELEDIVSNWTKNYTREQMMTKLQEMGIPAGIVQDAKDLAGDPQLSERQLIVNLEHPVMGFCNHPGSPRKLSKTPAQVRHAPCLGEHNHYVYTELLGMSDEEFVNLLEKGIFE